MVTRNIVDHLKRMKTKSYPMLLVQNIYPDCLVRYGVANAAIWWTCAFFNDLGEWSKTLIFISFMIQLSEISVAAWRLQKLLFNCTIQLFQITCPINTFWGISSITCNPDGVYGKSCNIFSLSNSFFISKRYQTAMIFGIFTAFQNVV